MGNVVTAERQNYSRGEVLLGFLQCRRCCRAQYFTRCSRHRYIMDHVQQAIGVDKQTCWSAAWSRIEWALADHCEMVVLQVSHSEAYYDLGGIALGLSSIIHGHDGYLGHAAIISTCYEDVATWSSGAKFVALHANDRSHGYRSAVLQYPASKDE